jgi:hypothetical protein
MRIEDVAAIYCSKKDAVQIQLLRAKSLRLASANSP